MTLPILYIHGAFSSELSFNYLRECLPEHQAEYLTYEVTTPLSNIVQDAKNTLASIGPCHIVSHSLGGVIGLSLAQQFPSVKSLVTISAPFGGSSAASLMGWFHLHPLFTTLNPSNSIMSDMHRRLVPDSFLNIVTTYGDNPMISDKNDSVVTVTSQGSIKAPNEVTIGLNHFEVLLSSQTVDLIRDFVWAI